MPAPSTRSPRVSMALSLGLHGLAVPPLLAAGASGSGRPANRPCSSSSAWPPPLRPPPTTTPPADATDSAAKRDVPGTIDLPPPEEPPPLDFADLKPIEPPHARQTEPPPQPNRTPDRPGPPRPSVRPPQDFHHGERAQLTAAATSPAPAIVWEASPALRTPPGPRSIRRARSSSTSRRGAGSRAPRPRGSAAEIVLWRGSGFDLLDRAALAAVRRLAVPAGDRDGHAVAAWVEIPVRFICAERKTHAPSTNSTSPPGGAACAARSPPCASAMPPPRSASARPSWWRSASAAPPRRSTATGARLSTRCRRSAA